MRLSDETGQWVWAGTARLAVALIDAIGGDWDPRHPLLAQAEQTALQLPNASSSLLAGAQLVRYASAGVARPSRSRGPDDQRDPDDREDRPDDGPQRHARHRAAGKVAEPLRGEDATREDEDDSEHDQA
jgi:hypothetical protein